MEVAEHLQKARRNWSFLELCDSHTQEHPDWCLIILHYVALHMADAMLHTNDKDHGLSHGMRHRELLEMQGAGDLTESALSDYLQLYSRSRALRYDELSTDRSEYQRMVQEVFRRLEGELCSHLADEQAKPKMPFEDTDP